jgi:hypothetical protein
MEGIDIDATLMTHPFAIKAGHAVFRIPDHCLFDHVVHSQNVHGTHVYTSAATLALIRIDPLDHEYSPSNRTNRSSDHL